MDLSKANSVFNYIAKHPEVIPVLIIIFVTLSIPLCIITFSKKQILSEEATDDLDSLQPRESAFFIDIDVRPHSGCIPWEGHPFLMEFREQDLIIEQSQEVQRVLKEMEKAKEELQNPEETTGTETETGLDNQQEMANEDAGRVENEKGDKKDEEEEETVESPQPVRKPKKIQALKLLAWNVILEESMKNDENLCSYYYFT